MLQRSFRKARRVIDRATVTTFMEKLDPDVTVQSPPESKFETGDMDPSEFWICDDGGEPMMKAKVVPLDCEAQYWTWPNSIDEISIEKFFITDRRTGKTMTMNEFQQLEYERKSKSIKWGW